MKAPKFDYLYQHLYENNAVLFIKDGKFCTGKIRYLEEKIATIEYVLKSGKIVTVNRRQRSIVKLVRKEL